VIAIRKIDDQAKNRDHDRDQNGDRQTLKFSRRVLAISVPESKNYI